MLKEQIKNDFLNAMKNKDIKLKVFLSVILGEIQNEESRVKNLSDENVLSILKKMEKSLKTTNTEESLKELEYIKPYLPTLMSEAEISSIIDVYIASGIDNIGKLMGEFNKNNKGVADNNIVSKIIKQKLKNV